MLVVVVIGGGVGVEGCGGVAVGAGSQPPKPQPVEEIPRPGIDGFGLVVKTPATMAEYWITEVEQPEDKPISHVCARRKTAPTSEHQKATLGAPQRYTRKMVIDDIEAGTNHWYTAIAANGKPWKRGAKVVLTKDKKFITTEGNSTTKDNLGELPKCTC